jgi:hypothetical protein
MWDNVWIETKMIKRINVTEKQIKRYNSPTNYYRDNYPVIEAINSLLKNNCNAEIYRNSVTFESHNGEFFTIKLPPEALEFNKKISQGVPFSFDLFIPNELLKSTRRVKQIDNGG